VRPGSEAKQTQPLRACRYSSLQPKPGGRSVPDPDKIDLDRLVWLPWPKDPTWSYVDVRPHIRIARCGNRFNIRLRDAKQALVGHYTGLERPAALELLERLLVMPVSSGAHDPLDDEFYRG